MNQASSRIARPYAGSLFLFSKERDCLDSVYADMRYFFRLEKDCRSWSLFLASPVIHSHHKAKIFRDIFKGHIDDITLNFCLLLVKKGREALLGILAGFFVDLYLKDKGKVVALLELCVSPSKSLEDLFKERIRAWVGKEPILEVRLRKELIGGFSLRLGHEQMDCSLRGGLQQLQQHFSK